MDALSTSEAKILDLQSTGFEFLPTKMKQTLYSNRIESGCIDGGVQAACRYTAYSSRTGSGQPGHMWLNMKRHLYVKY